MRLTTLNELVVSASSKELLADLDALKEQIDVQRPLDGEIVRRVEHELLGDRVHSSNSFEGNTHTLRETETILSTGQIVDVGRKREGQEVLNLGKAIDCVQRLIEDDASASNEAALVGAHRILLGGINDDIAGRYRNERVMITGAKHQPPRPDEIEQLMQGVFSQLGEATGLHPVVVATWIHWVITRVHPFEDGNGRMARLWQDYVLLSNHYTPAVIAQSQRKLYYASLQQADDGDFTELLQLVAQSATQTSQMYLNAIREADDVADWAAELVGEAEDLADDALKLQYNRWKTRVQDLRDAFARCMTQVGRKTTKLDLHIHNYDIIDQATWESLRSEPKAPQTWYFRISCGSEVGRFQYVFFAGKHRVDGTDSKFGIHGPHVCLYVSEKCGPDDPKVLSGQESLPLTFRELLIIDNALVRKRWDEASQTETYDRELSAITIAQDFIKEVVLHRLTT